MKNLYNLILLSALLTFIFSCEEEEPLETNGIISGSVIHALTEEPVSGARVSFSGINEIALTGDNGTFEFQTEAKSEGFTVQVEHSNFEEGKNSNVKVIAGSTTTSDFALTPKPAITVSPSSLDYGDSNSEISIIIKNVVSIDIEYEISTSNDWISLSKSKGELGTQNSATILATIDREKMELGLNQGSVIINITNWGTSKELVITGVYNPETSLEISPTQLDFGSSDDEKTLTLTNKGIEDVTYEITKSEDWISLNKTTGSVKALLQDLVNVTVDRSSLEVGDHDGSILINIPGSGSITVQVLTSKSALQSISLNLNELDFGTTDLTKEITLTNPNSVEIDYSVELTTGWLSLNKTSGLLSANQSTTFIMTLDRSQLVVGNNQTTVTFRSTEAGEVNLSVYAEKLDATSAKLEINTSTLNFGESLTSTELTIENTGSGTLSWSLDVTEEWLSADQASGTISSGSFQVIVVFVVRDGLTNGTYEGQLLFSGNGGNDIVDVNMTVNESGSGGGSDEDDDNDGINNSIDADDDGDGLIEINSIDDLNNMRYDLDADGSSLLGAPSGGFIGYELIKDLDFENAEHYEDIDFKTQFTSGSGWTPIGSSSSKFNTTIEGNDFTIKNLLINRTTDYTALIAYTSFLSEVRNLGIEIKFLSGDDHVAGLIAVNSGDVSGCFVVGSISSASDDVGLLIAAHYEGTVSHCYSEGNINSSGRYVGGLIGYLGRNNDDVWEVKNSYSSAKVDGHDYVGGLIGGRYNGTGTIKQSYAVGKVTATGQYIGGFIGNSNAEINSCYAKGNVQTAEYYVGGFVGSNSGNITSCYAIGTVEGSSNAGGFSGRNTGSIASSNYWDINTSGMDASVGGTSQTTVNLQGVTSNVSIYATWSTEAWDFGNSSQYPAIKNMPGGLEIQR